MKVYPITENAAETIEFRVESTGEKSSEGNQFALSQKFKPFVTLTNKTIIMNKREVLKLYQAIQTEVLEEEK